MAARAQEPPSPPEASPGAGVPPGAPSGPILWQRYTREQALRAVQIAAQGWHRFLSPSEFQWQSQNRNAQRSEPGQKVRRHQDRGIPVHLFVRRQARLGGTTQPFLYAGALEFQRWEGERPITVWWRMEEAVPEGLWKELRVGETPQN